MAEEPDYGDPAAVVRCFIRAMHEWETVAWQSARACRSTADPSSYQAEAKARMDDVFERYCTSQERKHGRQGSFQNPPEYDPEKELILDTQIEEKRAYVITQRQAVLGGRHRYTLIHRGGRWLIDTLKREAEGEWQNAIL